MRQQLITSMKHNNFDRTGRTDKNVSGSSQVLSFTVRSNLKEGLNYICNLSSNSVNTQHNFYLFLKTKQNNPCF